MRENKPIRILQVVSILNAGGMENYIMNLYRCIDRSRIQFDFIVHHIARGLYEEEIESLGGEIYHFSVLDDKNLTKYIRELNTFFKKHQEYKIVHGHLSSLAVLYLGAAKKNGIKWRIAHSHGAGFLHTPKGYAKYLLFRTTKWNANVRLACSTEAGRYLYGRDTFDFVPNGIDSARFSFNSKTREEIRRRLGIEKNFVIGHIGRFNLQKNHKFLLEIFKGVVEKRPEARLLLLGDGELYQKIREIARELDLQNVIVFAGVHKDVENYYQAMDVFALPSLFEGLPVTGIEAQYAGLPCYFSNKITREVTISPYVKYIKIDDTGLDEWITELIMAKENRDRKHINFITNDFDVKYSAEAMAKRYTRLWENA